MSKPVHFCSFDASSCTYIGSVTYKLPNRTMKCGNLEDLIGKCGRHRIVLYSIIRLHPTANVCEMDIYLCVGGIGDYNESLFRIHK